MEMYKVKWIDIWKGLSKGFIIAILIGFSLMILTRAMKCGFDYGETFKYLTPLGWLGFFIVSCVLGAALMLREPGSPDPADFKKSARSTVKYAFHIRIFGYNWFPG